MNYTMWISDVCEFFGTLRRRSVKPGWNWHCEIRRPLTSEGVRRDFRGDGLKDLIPDELVRFWIEAASSCYCHATMDLDADENQDLRAILKQQHEEMKGTSLSLFLTVEVFSPAKLLDVWKGRLVSPDDAFRGDRIEDMNTRNELGEWIPFFDYETGEYIAIESKHVRKVPRVAMVNVVTGPDRVRDVDVIADSFDEFLESWSKEAYRPPGYGGFRGAAGLVFSQRIRMAVRSKYLV